MKVLTDNLMLCSDCTQVACNGTNGAELLDKQATLDGLSKLGHLAPDFDSETGSGIWEFSSRICDSCGTSLAGYRARFAELG